jgi:ionotropic kainate glutamate receptor 2
MRKRSASQLSGNERFEGYAVDLLHELSLLYHFKYEILIQEDGSNGQKLPPYENGTIRWNGMMGEVIEEVRMSFLLVSK